MQRLARGTSPPCRPGWRKACGGDWTTQSRRLFGLLLAGVAPAEVAATLGLTPAAMEAQLCELLGRLRGPPRAT